MECITLGASGLKVSPICHGCWQASKKYWGNQPREKLVDAMRRAFEVGVNFYDTADAYGDGYSEEVVGEALAELPRDEIVVATKVYHHFYPDGHRHGDLSKEYILAECDASLKRLKMDYVDLYQCHSFDPGTDLAETAEAMETLVKAGKVRAYGLSNFTVEQMRLARRHGNFTTLQPRFNLMQRDAQEAELPCCKAEGMGTLVFSPLFHGMLTGKYDGTETFDDLRKGSHHFQGETFKELAERVKRLQPIAHQYDMTIVQLVLAVTLQHPLIDVAIVGIKTPKQIEEAAAVMGRTVALEDFHKVLDTVGRA